MDTPRLYVGSRIPRWEDRRLVMGQGRYTDDLRLPHMVHVAFVRSPYAHARLVSVRTDRALADPDAAAVLTGDDLVGTVEPFWSGLQRGPFRKADLYPLARDKVRMAGDCVAAVAAPSRYAAEDIAERVAVEYDPLPAVVSTGDGLAHGAPRLYEEWPDNVYSHQTFATPGLERAFAAAHLVVRRRFSTHRQTAAPLETRGCVADYDPVGGLLTVWVGHQDVHLFRITMAEVLRLPLHRVRVIAPDTGGAFGIKLPVYPEEMVCCALSMRLGRPVKWIQDRRESFLGDTHARETVVDAALALDRDGRILGLRAAVESDAGAYAVAGRGPAIEGSMFVRELPGPWKVPEYGYDLKVVMTNKAPIAVYRAVAIPNTTFVMERLLENAARDLDIDTVEMRRRNLVDAFPYTTVTGHVYDTGSYIESLDRALARVEYPKLRQEVETLRSAGRLVGIGICTLNDASARSGSFYGKLGLAASSQEGCQLTVDPSGGVTARFGTTTQGQGLGTALAQLIAERLGVPLAAVRVEMGDTLTAPYGGGAWASRGAVCGGAAALLAVARMREKLLAIGAHLLEAAAAEVELADGAVRVRGAPERMVTVPEIARQAYFIPGDIPAGMEPGLEVVSHWEPTLPATFSNATHVVVVEVLPGSGALRFLRYLIVEDCGTILNPGLVDGQLAGAVAQGIGGTLYEQLTYDDDGQLLTATLVDYLLPSAAEMPDLEIHHLQTPSTSNPGGFKGVAEAGTVGVPAAVANAVADALQVDVTALPLSPAQIIRLLERRKG